jgi:hypothetical protein
VFFAIRVVQKVRPRFAFDRDSGCPCCKLAAAKNPALLAVLRSIPPIPGIRILGIRILEYRPILSPIPQYVSDTVHYFALKGH